MESLTQCCPRLICRGHQRAIDTEDDAADSRVGYIHSGTSEPRHLLELAHKVATLILHPFSEFTDRENAEKLCPVLTPPVVKAGIHSNPQTIVPPPHEVCLSSRFFEPDEISCIYHVHVV